MLSETARLWTELSLRDNGFKTGLTGAHSSLTRFQRVSDTTRRGVSNLQHNLTQIAKYGFLAAGAAVIDATKAASDFQRQMELVRTQAGATQQEVDSITASVLKMATETGTAPEQLAQGLYHVESAGFRGAKALDALRIAAEGAKVGNTDLESVTNALVAAEQSGIRGTQDMSQAMGGLNAIVGAGNMRMDGLVTALSSGILPVARAFGLNLTEVGGAMATLSDITGNVVDSTTRLRMSLALLGAPTDKATTILEKIGLSGLQLANDMRKPNGLIVAMQDLYDHLEKVGGVVNNKLTTSGTDIITKAFGGGRSSSAIISLLQSLDLLKQKTDTVQQGVKDFGSAWDQTTKTAAYNWSQFTADVSELKVIIGTEMLPVVTRVFGTINKELASPEVQDGAKKLGQAISDMFSQQNIDKGVKVARDVFGYLKDLPWGAIKTGIEGAASAAKTAVDIFKSLPPGVQEGLITILAANKLTGGAVGSLAGEGIKALLGNLKTIYAGNVTVISAGSVGGGGGVPGVATDVAGGVGTAGVLATLGSVVAAGAFGVIGATAIVSILAALDPASIQDKLATQQNANDNQRQKLEFQGKTATQIAAIAAEQALIAFRKDERAGLPGTTPEADRQRTQLFRQGERSPGALTAATQQFVFQQKLQTDQLALIQYQLRHAQQTGDTKTAAKLSAKLAALNTAAQDQLTAEDLDSAGRHKEALALQAKANAIANKAGLTKDAVNTETGVLRKKNFAPNINVPVTVNSTFAVSAVAIVQEIEKAHHNYRYVPQ